MRCSNKYCYISGDILIDGKTPDEHIIPNALGGYLKCPDLVSEKINCDLFAKLDAELTKSVELAQLLTFKRDRGEQPSVIGTSTEGYKYSIKNKTGTLLPLKPFEFIDHIGKKFLKFPASQKEEYIISQLRKNPNLKREEIESKIKIVLEDNFQTIELKRGLTIFSNKEPFRGIAKIATNFAILNEINKNYFLDMLEFIKGSDDLSKIKLGYFYPKEIFEYEFGNDEVSHILYLKGSEKEHILYCYIELFNTHCFIVVLDQFYLGASIEVNYIWDVLKAKEEKKKISLDLTRNQLLQRSYMFYSEVEIDYKERLKRINEICNLKIIFK